MKILHVNNTAGTSVTFRDSQIALGHKAIVAQTFRGALPMNWQEDNRFYGDGDFFGKVAFSMQLAHLVRWADIVHIHGYFPPKGLRFISWFGKPMLLHFKGTEIRTGKWESMARFGNMILLSTPDLKRKCPDGVYLPNPLVLHGIKSEPNGTNFRVVNAHASNSHWRLEAKGTNKIREAVNGISGIEFVEITGKPYDVALRIYSSCNLAIDQLVVGWYGVFAIECMSMGIPTLGYVDTSIKEPNPVYPVTAGNLKDVIQKFIHDKHLLYETGERQQKFVLENHDPMHIAKQTIEYYEELLIKR